MALEGEGHIRAWVPGTGDPAVQVDWSLLPHVVNHPSSSWLAHSGGRRSANSVAFSLSSCSSSVSLAKSRPARLTENMFFLTESNTRSLLQYSPPHCWTELCLHFHFLQLVATSQQGSSSGKVIPELLWGSVLLVSVFIGIGFEGNPFHWGQATWCHLQVIHQERSGP